MSEKPIIHRTQVTSSRSWRVNDVSSEHSSQIEKLVSENSLNGSTETFTAEIKDGAVQINGKWYDSMDAVPAADRALIESMRKDLTADGNLQRLLDAITTEAASVKQTAEHRDLGAGMGAGIGTSTGTADMMAPGAVPKTNSARRILQVVLVVICAALAWAVMHQLKLV